MSSRRATLYCNSDLRCSLEISSGDLVAISHTPSNHSLGQITEKTTSSNEKKTHNISMFNKCYSLYIHVYIQLHMFYRDKWCYRSILLLYTEYRQVHIIYKHEHLYVKLTWVFHCKAKHHTILPEISKQFQQSSLWILDNWESANQLQKKKKNVSDVTNLQY